MMKLQMQTLSLRAVYENLDLKKEIFKKLDEVVKKDAILANTSGLDIDALAQVILLVKMVVGTTFSPATMRLLEVVRAEKTSDQVLATIMSVGKKLKKSAYCIIKCSALSVTGCYLVIPLKQISYCLKVRCLTK